MGFRWDRLPKLSRAVAQAGGMSGWAAGRAQAIAAAIGQAVGAELIVEPGRVDAVDPARLPEARAVARVDGVSVALDGALAARLAALAARDPRPELPAPRRLTPIEKDLLAYLATQVAGVRGARVGDAIGLDGPLVGLDVHCRVISAAGGVSGMATVMWRADAPPVASGVGGDLSRRSDALARLERVPVGAAVVLARIRLPLADVHALARRDVVTLGTTSRDAAHLCLARGAFAGTLAGGALTLTTAYQQGAPFMDATLAQDLPVELTCELARVTLTAKQVLELGPGAVVPLGARVGTEVALVAGGRVVARGELVDVEGEVALRVTSLP